MKPETEIETPRLVIRSWRKTDRDATVAMWCDPENGKYMTEPVLENVDEKYLSLVDTLEDEPDGYNFFPSRKRETTTTSGTASRRATGRKASGPR